MILTGHSSEAEVFLKEWRNDSAFIKAHTSGSTGTPKPIDLLKSDIIESARGTCEFFNLRQDSYLWLPLSTDYIAGKMMVVRADYANCTLAVEHPSNQPLSTRPMRMIDLLPIVPSQLAGLLHSPWLKMVRNIIVGGAPMSIEQEGAIRATGINVYATFGMTETCSHVALRNVTNDADVYEALPGYKFSVDNDGCLIIKNDHMSWQTLTTRDVVQLTDETRFKWLGRADNVINSGGIKLYPEVIEKKLHGLIHSEYYLTGRPSAKWGTELVMVIEGADIDGERIKAAIRNVLQPYELPREIIVKRKLDRTQSGKIIRTY